MIVKEEFLSKLRRYFVLNLYEVKIWTALLSRGVATAGELSDIANVPRSRSYDVLESLERKGFVLMKLGKPIKYLAVPPEEVLERVKKNLKEEADERVTRLEELKTTNLLTELSMLHEQGVELIEPSDLSGSLRGRQNIYGHLELSLKNAQKSVTLITTAEGFLRKAEGLKPILEKLKKRGVSIRIAAPPSKENKEAFDKLANFADIRAADTKSRFCVVDGKDVIFMILDDKDVHPTYDVGIWVNSPFFANTLETMFNNTWKNLKPFKPNGTTTQ